MSQTVLMVDDSIPLHALVRTHLEPHGLKLQSAYDGESALSMAASIHPSLILLDVNLPRLDGFEVCRTLKANPATATVPLLFPYRRRRRDQQGQGPGDGGSRLHHQAVQARGASGARAPGIAVQARRRDDDDGRCPDRAVEPRVSQRAPPRPALDGQAIRPPARVHRGRCRSALLRSMPSMARPPESQVLRGVAEILRGHCRAEDILCRVDGGIFAMLLNDTNSANAAHMADRLRADVQRRMRSCGGVEIERYVQLRRGRYARHGRCDSDRPRQRRGAAGQAAWTQRRVHCPPPGGKAADRSLMEEECL